MKKVYIGEKIRALRIQRGLTLKQLGEEVDFNYSNLSKIERGIRKPTVEFLLILSSYFKVDITHFFDSEGNVGKQAIGMDPDWVSLFKEMKTKNVTFDELREVTDTIATIKAKVR